MKSIVVFIFLLIFSSEVFSMGFGPKVCLASELTMTVLKNGQPVEGAKVVRTYQKDFGDMTVRSQEATTDSQGKIVLPAVFDRTFRKYLPIESWIKQRVIIFYDDAEYTGVSLTKMWLSEWGEFNYMPSVESGIDRFIPYEFTCEITDEPEERLKDMHGHGKFYGVCKHISEVENKEGK